MLKELILRFKKYFKAQGVMVKWIIRYFFKVERSSKVCIVAPQKLSSQHRTLWSLNPTASWASLEQIRLAKGKCLAKSMRDKEVFI